MGSSPNVGPRFGTDGVRGVAGTELTTQFVHEISRAAARVLGASRVFVGGDTRESTPDLLDAVAHGFAAEGVDVSLLGIAPTPAVAWVAAHAGCAAAVVTASHNPYTDNGVKFFAAGGCKLGDDVEAAIEAELARLGTPPAVAPAGRIASADEALEGYVAHFGELFPGRPLDGLRLTVDAANGAMSDVAPRVLSSLGAELVVLHASPNGRNINARCGATHPQDLVEIVRRDGVDAGLAFDGDGDRVIAVDSSGALIDGDRLMAIVAPVLRRSGRLRKDTVVVTVMTNLGFRRAMDAAGIDVLETPVGDRYVLEALEREGLSLGGEQSGHVIFRDLATTGDGLLAGIVLLDAVRRAGVPLVDLAAAAMTSYPQVLVNVRLARIVDDIASLVTEEIAAAQAELGGDGRVLVRRSGTEPLARVMVEAATDEHARTVAEHLAAAIERRLGPADHR